MFQSKYFPFLWTKKLLKLKLFLFLASWKCRNFTHKGFHVENCLVFRFFDVLCLFWSQIVFWCQTNGCFQYLYSTNDGIPCVYLHLQCLPHTKENIFLCAIFVLLLLVWLVAFCRLLYLPQFTFGIAYCTNTNTLPTTIERREKTRKACWRKNYSIESKSIIQKYIKKQRNINDIIPTKSMVIAKNIT